MNTDLKTAETGAVTSPDGSPPAVGNTYHLQQTGAGTNIGVAQNVDATIYNVYLPAQGSVSGMVASQYAQQYQLNSSHYSLFVINGETFDKPYFLLDMDRALTVRYGTAQEINERLAPLSREAIEEIKTYPAIFATENFRYNPGLALPGTQVAYYGIVLDVKVMQNKKVKVFYQTIPSCGIPQELLNQMITELDIHGNYKLNELDKTHWSVKNVNLIEEMRLKGINLFAMPI